MKSAQKLLRNPHENWTPSTRARAAVPKHPQRRGKDNLVTQEAVPPASILSLAVTAPEPQGAEVTHYSSKNNTERGTGT